MNCKNCKGQLTKKQKAFCSIKCKSEFQANQPKETFDETKQYECLIDGKLFNIAAKRAGALKKYSKNVLNKEFDENDWKIIEKNKVEIQKWNCPHCNWSCKCNGQDLSGWIGKHLLDKHQIDKEQHIKDYPAGKTLWKMHWIRSERINKINESEENRIQCLECGEYMISITTSHLKKHGMTKQQYRNKHNIQILSSDSFRNEMSKLYYQNDNLLNSNSWRSKYEDELCNLLKSFNIEYIPNHKKFGFDLDIYCPNNNIAIEFNGLYYHSVNGGSPKGKNYHLNKTKNCEKIGIHLIHIFEDEWNNKNEIVISRLKNLFKKNENIVYARNCIIQELDYQTASKFIEINHIQGSLTTSRINLGLFFNDDLISVMTFGLPRKSTGKTIKDQNEFELQRFCNKLNYSVIGGASKLLKHFEKTYNVSKIFSFADRRWTSAIKKSLYDELGFVKTSFGEPNYWYLIEPMKRTSRYSYTKNEILRKFPDVDPNLSEWDIMLELGFDWIWDCGSMRYEKVYDDSVLIHAIEQKITISRHKGVQKRKRVRKKTTRNLCDVRCEICETEHSIVGIASHFKSEHDLTPDQYVELGHPEYRPLQLKQMQMIKDANGKFKCEICKLEHGSEKALTNHIKNDHNLNKIQYIIQEFCNGIEPRCKCGCGKKTKIKTFQPYIQDFVSGHGSKGENNPMFGRKHSKESKIKMSKPKSK